MRSTIIYPRAIACVVLSAVAASAALAGSMQNGVQRSANPQTPLTEELRHIEARYEGDQPAIWRQDMPGVTSRLPTARKVIALTFDACGGRKGNGYDAALIDYLRREKIPATLFLTSRWIDANMKTAQYLAGDPLFEIENHGLSHRPCSVDGKSEYHIPGTQSVREVINEVDGGARSVALVTHRRPRWFRAGTATYDDIAVRVIRAMGYRIAGYTISGDAGATFDTAQVKASLLKAKPGAIVLCHMNHPKGHTAQGIIAAIPELRKRGFQFIRLSDLDKPAPTKADK